jgi:hypothetical protein
VKACAVLGGIVESSIRIVARRLKDVFQYAYARARVYVSTHSSTLALAMKESTMRLLFKKKKG